MKTNSYERSHSLSYPVQGDLALIASMAFGEPQATKAINQNFHNILAHGIYEGFDVVPAGGLTVQIAGVGSRNTLAARHSDVTLTIHAQAPVIVTIPTGRSALVVDSFYQYGVKTAQVDIKSNQESAEYKIIKIEDKLDRQVLLAEFDIPNGTTTLSISMIDTTTRSVGGIGVDGHVKQYDPHLQYVRDDGAATDSDISNEKKDKKQVNLPQLWQALSKRFLERTISVAAPLRGSSNLSHNVAITIDSATTAARGAVQLSSSITSNSELMAATPKAIKSVKTLTEQAQATADSKWSFKKATDVIFGAVTLRDGVNLSYGKSAGIAATPLAVKTAFDKATTALSVANSKWAYVEATTGRFGAIKLTNATNSTSQVLAPTANALKVTYQHAAKGVNDAAAANANANTRTPLARKISTTLPLRGGATLGNDLVFTIDAATKNSAGVVILSSALNSNSEALAATPKAVKIANDNANTAQALAATKWVYKDATATVKGAVVLNDSVTATSNASQSVAATPKAVKQAYDKGVEALNKANSFTGHNHDAAYLGINATAKNSEKLGGLLPADYQRTDDTLEFTYSGAPTDQWENTGIKYSAFPSSGTYVVQVYIHKPELGFYTCYWSGVCSIYKGAKNDFQESGILLNRSGHASSQDRDLFLRNIMTAGSDANLGLQIKVSGATSTVGIYTIKFRKLI